MSEKMTMFAILGTVVLVAMVGMFFMNSENRLTGMSPTDSGTELITVGAEYFFNWTVNSVAGSVDPENNNEITFDLENGCTGDNEPCTAAGFAPFEGYIGSNVDSSLNITLSSYSPFNGSDTVQVKAYNVVPDPDPGCNTVESYTTISGETLVFWNVVPATTFDFSIRHSAVDVATNPPGDTTVTITGTVGVGDPACGVVP